MKIKKRQISTQRGLCFMAAFTKCFQLVWQWRFTYILFMAALSKVLPCCVLIHWAVSVHLSPSGINLAVVIPAKS